MITYSGRSVWPSWTTVDGVPTIIGPSLEDIAVGLGRQSRFAGQTREFYTVLCHSLVTGQVARRLRPGDGVLRMFLLLHDGHESVLSDTPTTWKGFEVKDNEDELDKRIFAEHLLEMPDESTLALAKKIDAAALAAEAHALGHAEAEIWWPRANFDSIADFAYELTVTQLRAGMPFAYLQPQNAIRALRTAVNT